MNNYQINVNQLPVGAQIYVEGEVSFSRIARHIEGDELTKDMQRRQQRGMTPITQPYTSITVQNAKIREITPGQLSVAEQYIQERFYTSSNQGANGTKYYSSVNKSPFLPNVSQYNPNDNSAAQVNLNGNELASGLKVILCLSVYKPKNYHNNGVGLDGIIVMEPIRYYTAQNQDLSALGITWKPLPGDEARAAITPPSHNQNTNQTTEQPTQPMNPPVPDPVGNQFSSQVQNANQMAQQNMAATPVANAPANQMQNAPAQMAQQNNQNQAAPMPEQPASPWICQNCGNTNAANMNFCNNCGSKKQENKEPVNNPYAQGNTPAQPAAGIVYNADDTQRNY